MEIDLHNIKLNAIGRHLQNNWKEVAYVCHHIATGVPEIRRINELKDGLNSFTGKSSSVAIKYNGLKYSNGLKINLKMLTDSYVQGKITQYGPFPS